MAHSPTPDAPLLDGPVLAPHSGGPAEAAVVLLHGYGADGNDLAGLAPLFAERLPDALFAAPHAPHACEGNPFGRQWFGLDDLSPARVLAGARDVAPALDRWIDALLAEHEVPAERLVLAGFSQGALMALHVGLRRSPAPAAILSWSGWLAGAETLAAELRGRPPVLLVHGDADQIVPYAAMGLAETALRTQGLSVESVTCPGLAHGIDAAGLESSVRFIERRLAG